MLGEGVGFDWGLDLGFCFGSWSEMISVYRGWWRWWRRSLDILRKLGRMMVGG